MSQTDPTQPALPGLEDGDGRPSALEVAARRTLRALWNDGVLGESHALMCQLVIDLARAVDQGTRAGKASAAAMAAAQLREAWATLLPDADATDTGDAFDQLAADLRNAAGLAQ